jgi:hypothetical protein
MDQRGVPVAAIELQQPSLDDVFLALTGRGVEEASTARTVPAEAA